MSGHHMHDLDKRSSNKRYRMHLAARFSPSDLPILTSTASSATSDTQKSATPNPTSAPATTTSSTSTSTSTTPTTSAQQSSTSTTPITSSSSTTSSSTTSSSTPSTSSTSTSSSSSSTVVPQTVLSTTPAAVVTLHTTAITTGPTGITLGTGTIASATPSATSTSSGSVNTTAVVGGIAGSLVGLAVLGFLIMWCIRRNRKADEEEWSAAAFKRQSAILVDDPEPYNPRPPTMIERHNASPALAAQRSYQNFYGGYGQQAPYGPAETMHTGSPPLMQPHVQMAMGRAPHEDHSQLARQPSNATYLSPTAAGYAIPNDPQAHYVNLDRSSVTPFQAAQYADISRQLGGDPHSMMAPPKPVDSALLPSPFDDETYTMHDAEPRAPSPAHVADLHAAASTASTPEPAPASRGREITNAKRPDTVYTMYDEGDAYDGI